jgi:hypothetical protein
MWRAPTTNLSAEVLDCSCQPVSSGRNDWEIYEGEGDCTSETGAGQFSIFGAIEEKNRHGFSPIDSDEETA